MPRREFANVAPRLERAHRERRAELAAESEARIRAAWRVQSAERLVAHRELQLARGETGAFAAVGTKAHRGKRRYVKVRTNKLEAAREQLRAARECAAELGLDL